MVRSVLTCSLKHTEAGWKWRPDIPGMLSGAAGTGWAGPRGLRASVYWFSFGSWWRYGSTNQIIQLSVENLPSWAHICDEVTTDMDLVGFILEMLMQGEAQNAAPPLAACLHPHHGHEVQHHHDVRTKQAFVCACNSAPALQERRFFQLFLCTRRASSFVV